MPDNDRKVAIRHFFADMSDESAEACRLQLFLIPAPAAIPIGAG
jgi:hypothetical protein